MLEEKVSSFMNFWILGLNGFKLNSIELLPKSKSRARISTKISAGPA
jgi:hypothetical protein